MKRPAFLVSALALAAFVAALAAAAPEGSESAATALVSRVSQPGQPDQVSMALSGSGEQALGGYAYPDDGSIVRIGSAIARVATLTGPSSSVQADVGIQTISLLGGEITMSAIDARGTATAGSRAATAGLPAFSISGLTVLGQPVGASANSVIPLGDWGRLELLGARAETVQNQPRSARVTATALRVRLNVDHGGLAAGSSIELGTIFGAASAVPGTPGATGASGSKGATPSPDLPADPGLPATPGFDDRVKPARGGQPASTRPVVPADAPKEPGRSIPGAPPELVLPSPEVSPALSTSGYVFPVYGPASFGDTFGAPRADVPGGWHHGEDIFAPLGTPLLAVADGTVFSVGWNDIGGWRLWLRDRFGNEFYYAHLSAYSLLAVNGKQVKAGQVLGFMGKTGDAEYSPVHVHFEIHPVSLLAQGYDGAVAPYPFLVAWHRAEDVSFDTARVYLPSDGSSGGGYAAFAGAVLLGSDDISSTSGLVPGALASTLAGRAPQSPAVGRDR